MCVNNVKYVSKGKKQISGAWYRNFRQIAETSSILNLKFAKWHLFLLFFLNSELARSAFQKN